MPSKEFHDLMKECIEIHDKKSHDYASDKNPFSNFEGAAEIVEQFIKPIDQVFAGIIGIKLTRLAQLLNGKTPLNESIDDTFKDAVNYFALWGAYYRSSGKDIVSSEKLDLATQYSEARDRDYAQKADDLPFGTVPGQVVPVKSTSMLPNICSNCNTGSAYHRISHTIAMHGAVYNESQQTVKYPNEVLYLLDRKFWENYK